MKIKVFLLTIFMLLFLTGCSLFGTPTVEPTNEPTVLETPTVEPTVPKPTPTPEPVELIDIYVKNTEELYCNVGEVFKPSKLSVIAKYSDDSEVNVTDESTFSTILTNTIGKKELTITYENKTIKVLVDILKPIGLELDITKTKTQYEIGDVINITGLKVYNLYEDIEKKESTSFVVIISDENENIIPVNSKFDTNGVYTVRVSCGNFTDEYQITVGDTDEPTQELPEPSLYTITLEVNTADGIQYIEKEVYEDSKLEDFIIEVEGFMFLGFEKPFSEWKYLDKVVIKNTPIKEDKCILGFIGNGYVYHHHTEYNKAAEIERNELVGGPNYLPEGTKFVYWDLPLTFNIMDNRLVEGVYIPTEMGVTNLTKEKTVHHISSNAIDVNIEEFINASPTGYVLNSITLSLNGEIVKEVPYEESMLSAYFNNLTGNTKYEVGAYYIMETSTFRTIDLESTPGFHYCAYSVVTTGNVMYRLVLTYNGEYLYRHYFAEGTDLTQERGLYTFELPEKYRDYKCAGTLANLNTITSDSTIEVVLVAPAGNKCTVVFYAEDKMTILKVEEVDLQHSATAPTIKELYYSEDGVYKYTFNGWSESFDVVLNNLYLYPKYYGEIVGESVAKETIYAGNGFTYFEIEFNEIYRIRDYVIQVKYYNENTNKETLIIGYAYVIHDDCFRYETHMLYETPRETVAIFDLHYRYTLSDGRGEQNYVKRITVDTIKPCISPGYSIEYTNITHNSIIPTCDKEVKAYFYSVKDTFIYALLKENTKLESNTEYEFYYALPSGESDNLYYVYSNRDDIIKTLDDPQFTVHMGYSGYQGELEEFEFPVYEDSKPEDFIRTVDGYFFLGFSTPFDEWENEFVKIYIDQIKSGKCIVSYVTDDYVLLDTQIVNTNTNISSSDVEFNDLSDVPEGMKFAYWDMPETLKVTENMYIKPVFIPEDLDTTNLTEEATVNNVSANAIDVNVEEFLNATPEGYSLDSITLGLNGEVLYEIPYEEGMVSAYFTNLTVDTEYEVGAYYSQNQATTLAFRKTRQLTYRFHFVGFMIVTKGDVLHRVRMMYQGDVLYRWYYSPDTYVSNYHFFYDFQLPIEYDGYECVGCEEVVGYITQDIDLEVVLIKKDDNYCTVVFYSGEYINGDLTILKTEVVPKGGTATPPSVPDYDDGRYLYRFDYWNGNYSNVTENEFVYARYKMEPLFVPQVYMNVIVGDTYCYIFGESDTPELWLLCKYELYDVASNEMLEDGFTEINYSNKFLVSSKLQPGKEYVLNFGYFTQEKLPINVMTNTYECAFTTRLGIEKTNYTFTTSSTPYSFKINEVYSDVIMYMQRLVEDDGSLGTPSIVSSGYLCQNLSFCVNPVLKGDVDYCYFVYFDDIMVSTLDAVIPTIENAQITNTQGEITVYGNISDPTEIVRYVQLVYKTTDNSNYITKTCNITGNTSINFDLTIDLSVVDPDTGITHYYEISEAYLSVVYIYNGYGSNKIKRVFDVVN